jgi:23S rRNA (guanosine2251-2'-O)-methyltransferase
MAISLQDKRSLEEIHQLFLSLERSESDFKFDAGKLDELKKKILQLQDSPNPDVNRLQDMGKHLSPGMSLQHFINFVLPIERLINKNLRDDEFLVLENDKTEIATEKLPLVFVLDNIRSAFNVGSIFRTAECVGAERVILCGYTPTPAQSQVEKTAMGTQDYVDWEEGGKLFECLESLKENGYRIIALETAATAVDLYEPFEREPTAFILGNERFGLDPEILKVIDETRIIPLRGRKNSLNVGVTAAVAGFEWMRQWQNK